MGIYGEVNTERPRLTLKNRFDEPWEVWVFLALASLVMACAVLVYAVPFCIKEIVRYVWRSTTKVASK